MERILLIGLGTLLALSIAGCAPMAVSPDAMDAADSAETAYHKISSEAAKEMMDAGGVTIVDVRTAGEYAGGHVPAAINIPNEEIDDEPPEALADKDAVLLVYCRSGRRSRDASDKLVAMGYTQVYDFGGIIDWTYDTVKGG